MGRSLVIMGMVLSACAPVAAERTVAVMESEGAEEEGAHLPGETPSEPSDDVAPVVADDCVVHRAPEAAPAGGIDVVALGPQSLDERPGASSCLVVRDLDGDGWGDVLWGGVNADGDPELSIRWGLPDRQGVTVRYPREHVPFTCLVREEAGSASLLFSDETGVWQADGLEDHRFAAVPLWQPPEGLGGWPFSMAQVDFDLDGDDEILLTVSGVLDDCPYVSVGNEGGVTLEAEPARNGDVLCLENTPEGYRLDDGTVCPSAVVGHETVFPFHIGLQDLGDDGVPDVLLTADFDENTYLKGTAAGFTDISETSGIGTYAHAMGAAWLDLDRDGLRDLYMTDVGPAAIHMNHDCDRFFETMPAQLGMEGIGMGSSTWGALPVDLDHNGDEELILTRNADLGDTPQGNLCSGFGSGFERPPDMLLQRVEGDVWESSDLLQRTAVWQTDWKPILVGSADLDGDGGADLVFSDPFRGVVVHWNDTPAQGRWVGVRPVDASGSEALPVRVVVETPDGSERVREHWPVTGSTIQSEPVVRVGVGEVEGPVAVRIRWPDGQWTRHADVALDAVMTLTQSEGVLHAVGAQASP